MNDNNNKLETTSGSEKESLYNKKLNLVLLSGFPDKFVVVVAG